jgi:hypothetical protein
MTAVTQVRYPHSQGRAYYDKKLAEGKTAKEALRALKRQVSDAFYKHLKADAARGSQGPGGQTGNDSVASAAGSHPECQLFGKATPGPQPSLRPQPKPTRKTTSQARRKSLQALDTKRLRSARLSRVIRWSTALAVVSAAVVAAVMSDEHALPNHRPGANHWRV